MSPSPVEAILSDSTLLFAADVLGKATILLVLAALIDMFLRRSSSAFRHRLWAVTLCGLVLLPGLSWTLPGWRLPVLPATDRTSVADLAINAGAQINPETGDQIGRASCRERV